MSMLESNMLQVVRSLLRRYSSQKRKKDKEKLILKKKKTNNFITLLIENTLLKSRVCETTERRNARRPTRMEKKQGK